MRALVSDHPGGPNTLIFGEMPEPAPAHGEVRIQVESCGINFPDTLVIEDKYQAKPPRPFSPGGEVAGTVDALGEGVTGLSVGDRVAALTYLGGLAEKICTDHSNVRSIPGEIAGAEAAILMSTYATAFYALVDRGGLKADDTVLVIGAAGGVGSAAVQIAKAFGSRVVAAVSSADKARQAQKDGADEIVQYPSGLLSNANAVSVGREFKKVIGKTGANIVFDPVGGVLAESALRAMAWQGRYLVIGFTASIPAPPWNLVLLKGCSVIGVLMNEFARRDPAAADANLDRLFALYKCGKLVPAISAYYSFGEARAALAAMGDRRAIGKLVVTIGEQAGRPYQRNPN